MPSYSQLSLKQPLLLFFYKPKHSRHEKCSILNELVSNLIKRGIVSKTSYLSIYIPWPFPPVSGVADNTKEAALW